ncbi:MAG: sodium/pantothenate symporter [Clostridium sp.]|uniref:sodium/pantothenate symporter n=1 Tax=Clostridium sp. TaxID=1506 RepID=UPI00304B2FF3
MKNLLILIPIVIYLALNLCIGLWISRSASKENTKNGFINNYFIGGRSMGGFVLAMTMIATFTSAGSFIGGPGIAYSVGLSWVLVAVVQAPTAFLTFGILGKKFAIIARKINAITVTDYLAKRYESPTVVILSSLALVIFFIVTMVAQFIGGAVLFQSITGYSYLVGLILFGTIVILYTTIGGFKAVVITDTIQGIVMLFGTVLILYSIIKTGGGLDAISAKLTTINPAWSTPLSGGNFTPGYILSFWVLVGIGTLGLPQNTVRAMGFKDTKSMHNAMIYGTIVFSALMFGMLLAGVLSGAILPPGIANSDIVIPTLVIEIMNPLVAGIFLAAPLAAVMSTVSSMLILSSAAIIKDIYLNYFMKIENIKEDSKFEKKISRMSLGSTAIIGIIVFLLSIQPPDLLTFINLFAFGGLEAAFFCPVIFGLYWKRANATGSILSMIFGIGSFILLSSIGFTPWGIQPIVPTLLISIVSFVIGSYLGKRPDGDVLKLFYGTDK